jgi:uncharacterized membrane protein
MTFDEIMEQIRNPVDETMRFDPSDIARMKPFTLAACFPMLFWLPLVIDGGTSEYGKFYANQGLIVSLLSILGTVVRIVCGFIPFIGGLIGWVLGLAAGILCIAAFVFCIKNAAEGKAVYIPFLGQMIEVFK